MSQHAHYQELLSCYEGELSKLQQRIRYVGTLRLFLILLLGSALYLLRAQPLVLLITIGVVLLVLFLLLVRQHNRLYDKRTLTEAHIAYLKRELQLLDYNFEASLSGSGYNTTNHDYCHDLDLFGNKSLFAYLNRAATILGQDRFAQMLLSPLKKSDTIRARQEAVAELALLEEFRRELYCHGVGTQEKKGDIRTIQALASSARFDAPGWLRFTTTASPLLLLLLIQLSASGLLSSSYAMLLFLAQLMLTLVQLKRLNALHATLNKTLASLGKYQPILQLIEAQTFHAQELQGLQASLSTEGRKASKRIASLAKLLNNLDQRYNFAAAILLNGLCLWDFKQLIAIDRWRTESEAALPQWLSVVGEMEALASLASLRFNHPHFTFPMVVESSEGCFVAEELGHPLIPELQRVCNPANIASYPSFWVVTGANMAGKSTYLRTLGVNFLLASIGAPVCATSCTFAPATLFTSLRTTDSLSENESYFFAELKRLQLLIDRLRRGEQMFVLLDEVLKGTNSVDKQKGSLALVRQLITQQVAGVIATHDLVLGELAKEHPHHVAAYCFEADIVEETLTFSYKLREGVAQNMNACFLMKQMGIIQSDRDSLI